MSAIAHFFRAPFTCFRDITFILQACKLISCFWSCEAKATKINLNKFIVMAASLVCGN